MRNEILINIWAFGAFLALAIASTGWLVFQLERMRRRVLEMKTLNDAMISVFMDLYNRNKSSKK